MGNTTTHHRKYPKELIEKAHRMKKEGYGKLQIAEYLNIKVGTLHTYFSKNYKKNHAKYRKTSEHYKEYAKKYQKKWRAKNKAKLNKYRRERYHRLKKLDKKTRV